MIIPILHVVVDIIGKEKGITASELRKKISWLDTVY